MLVKILYLVVTYGMAVISTLPMCRRNEEFLVTSSACRKTCEFQHVPCLLYVLSPLASCQCIPGYILNDKNDCIKVTDCPNAIAVIFPLPMCRRRNEELTTNSACRKTCELLHEPCPIIAVASIISCECIPGYVLNDKDDCIKVTDCPSMVLVESGKLVSKRCGLNEKWVESLELCPPTCEFRDPPCPRLEIRKRSGCQCKPGFILLNDVERFCVKESTCPKTCSKQLFVWSDCGTRCPSTCLQPGTIACVRICEPGCFCPSNYLLNEFTMECVKWPQCPMVDETA